MHVGVGGFGLLCFMGVLVGASLVAAGVCMGDGPAPIISVVSGGARALAAFVRRNAASVGLVMVSCAYSHRERGTVPRSTSCERAFPLRERGSISFRQ
jgi:hypothetical protein